MSRKLPIVLVIGGHDPTGGAGVQKDIETITSLNCHAVSLITCLTSQNTENFSSVNPVNPNEFAKQAKSLFSDVSIDVIKIGAIGSLKIAEKISDLLNYFKKITVVLDPVIKTSSGGTLINKEAIEGLKSLLFPKSFLITPNLNEAKSLSGKKDLKKALEVLFSFSPKYILMKDIEKSQKNITNNLYSKKKLLNRWSNPRIEGKFHGTGCTLASSIASFIARSENIQDSIDLGQQFTFQSIKNAIEIGEGQKIIKSRNEK